MEQPQLFESVYDDVAIRAAYLLRREPAGHSLDVSALVAEAWMRGFHGGPVAFNDRNHALAVAALSLRRVLVDRARHRKAVRRGGELSATSVASLGPFELDKLPVRSAEELRIQSVRLALLRLEGRSPELARLVSLKFNHGLEHSQIGLRLGLSARTVKRRWLCARDLLRSYLECAAYPAN